MKKIVVLTVLILFNLTALTLAKVHLNEEEISRVKVVKETLKDVDKKSLRQMVDDIENTPHPELNLRIKEAMAQAYQDIVKENHVVGLQKKEWLYSMVALNMAYFQFGGDKDSAGGVKNLNKLIRYKLKMYLPPNIFNQPGFHASIE